IISFPLLPWAGTPSTRAGCSKPRDVLPDVAEDTVSPARARTMKDYENQITDLKKENFNLKLRIYFLEERMQQKFDGPTEEIYKINIELKVEIESLKRELQEREKLLIKAYKAVESLAQGGDAEVQHGKEAQKKMQEMEEMLTGRINLLEEVTAQEEVEKALAMTEKEKALRIAAEQKLASIINAPAKDVDKVTEAEKDRSEVLPVMFLTAGILYCSSGRVSTALGLISLVLPLGTGELLATHGVNGNTATSSVLCGAKSSLKVL
uniref:Centrosomin N-terminal motif 1 domain-containing protein n=1 Tax=Serinus canaria TaxID=9135 RepID=A0A8C9MV54_SERCA